MLSVQEKHARRLEVEQPLEYPHDFLPQDDQRAEHGGHVDRHGESQVLLPVDAGEVGGDGQVAAAAHGQVFGQSLQDAHP